MPFHRPVNRNLRLSVLLLLLILLSPGCTQAPARPKVDSPGVASVAPQSQWLTQPVCLIGIGDSVTDGFGATEGQAYFDRLSEVRLPAVFPDFESTNYSVSATISLQHYEKQIPQIPVFAENVHGLIVITSGGNDILHNYGRTPPREGATYGATMDQARPWIENYEKRLIATLKAVNERFPGGCDIFVANIYDPTDGQGDIENAGQDLPPWKDGLAVLGAYNEVIARTVDSQPNYHLVDIHKAFMGHGIHQGGQPYWYYTNLEDPNNLGYAALEELFWQAMEQVATRRGWRSAGG